MGTTALERELKRGSTELLILALIEDQPRHRYEIGRLIEHRAEGTNTFHVASLYPTLYRLEDRGLIEGRWVERPEQRRRKQLEVEANLAENVHVVGCFEVEVMTERSNVNVVAFEFLSHVAA